VVQVAHDLVVVADTRSSPAAAPAYKVPMEVVGAGAEKRSDREGFVVLGQVLVQEHFAVGDSLVVVVVVVVVVAMERIHSLVVPKGHLEVGTTVGCQPVNRNAQ
jgi:hypothetical protein